MRFYGGRGNLVRLTGEGGRRDFLDRVIQAVCVDCFVILPRNDRYQSRWIKSGQGLISVVFLFNRSGFNSPKLASFLIHKVYIKCLGACPEDLYFFRMKENFIDFGARTIRAGYRWTFRALGVLALILVVRSSMFAGTTFFLGNGDISIVVNEENGGALQDVTFDGVSQGSNSSIEFFYRLDSDGSGSRLITLEGPNTSTVTSIPDSIEVRGVVPSLFDFKLTLSPIDLVTGDGFASLDAELRIFNITGTHSFSIFGLFNFDLDASSINDIADSVIEQTVQEDFPYQVTTYFDGLIEAGGPITPEGENVFFEIPDLFDLDATPDLKNALTDVGITNLSGNGGTVPDFGPGDASFAYQWDFSAGPNG